MEDELICPVEGCDHEPFKTPQARLAHIRAKHPEYMGEESTESKVPIVEEHFIELLRKFRIRADVAKNIADNISQTGGPRAFEDPEKLLERLSLWSKEIPAHMRRNILDQWFAETGVDIPPEIQKKAGMATEEIKKIEDKEKEEADVRYVYDSEIHQIRMANKDETGGTLSQAKEVKRLAEEDEKANAESPLIMDGEGNWILNSKARITPTDFLAFQSMKKSQEKGEPVDMETAMMQAAEKMKLYREMFGGGGTQLPAWMTDPAAFIKTIESVTSGDKGDSALKAELAEMRQTIETMKDERYANMFANLQEQIKQQSSVLSKAIENMSEMEKNRVGRTEMDIIHEIASEGIKLAKTELPGLRKDIKDAVGSVAIPPGKSSAERETRKQEMREAIDADREIEEIGKELFFAQS